MSLISCKSIVMLWGNGTTFDQFVCHHVLRLSSIAIEANPSEPTLGCSLVAVAVIVEWGINVWLRSVVSSVGTSGSIVSAAFVPYNSTSAILTKSSAPAALGVKYILIAFPFTTWDNSKTSSTVSLIIVVDSG